MKAHLRTPASRELADAVKWYESQRPGLGRDFALAVKRAVARIEQYPLAAPARLGVRSALVSDFPYTLWYRIEADGIYIYALAHSHRDPHYWIDRLE